MKEAPLRTVTELVERGLAPPEQKAELERVAARYAVAVPAPLAELIMEVPGQHAARDLHDLVGVTARAGTPTTTRCW